MVMAMAVTKIGKSMEDEGKPVATSMHSVDTRGAITISGYIGSPFAQETAAPADFAC